MPSYNIHKAFMETTGSDNKQGIARIKQLINSLGVSQSAFAERIGIDASNFSKHLNGKLPLSDNLYNKIVVAVGASKKWLLTGEGDMWNTSTGSNSIIPTVTVGNIQQGNASGAKIYDIDVTAGGVARERMFADDLVIGSINIPTVHPDCCIVRVSGDSMTPVIGNGDLIAIREIRNKNLIFWGHIYVVLLDEYRMVKYIRRHTDPSQVILRSENRQYDDIEVAKSDIRDLFLVENIIRIDNRI